MSDPFVFDSTSPRYGLPLLFVGQAQKEVWVNEALSRIDALLHLAIEAELATPPAAPVDGRNWLVATGATGDWAGKSGQIACRQAGNWIFIAPRDGMRVLDAASGQERLFRGIWRIPAAPAEPIGGSTVDVQARSAIGELITVLRVAGILPAA